MIFSFLTPLAQADLIDAFLKPERITLVGVLLLVLTGFARGWIVPRFILDAETKRADRMEEQAFRTADALGRDADAQERTADALRVMAETIEQLQRPRRDR